MPTKKVYLQRNILITLFIFIVGSLWATYDYHQKYQQQQQRINEHTQESIKRMTADIQNNIGRYEYGLRGLLSAIQADGAEQFNFAKHRRVFLSRDYDREFPGARGFGVIELVKPGNEADFIERMKRERNDTFSIRTLTEHDKTRFVIKYIEPELVNEEAVGLDIGSEQNRREAAIEAARYNDTRLTRPITLVQANQHISHGFLILLPIFKQQLDPEATSAQFGVLYGWVYSPLLINEILSATTSISDDYAISIADISKVPNIDFYNNGIKGAARVASSTKSFTIFGRTWQLTIIPTEAAIEAASPFSQTETILINIALVILSTAAGYLLLSLLSSSYETLSNRIRLATIVDNMNEGVMGVDENFCLSHWNRTAKRIFGIDSEHDVGRPLFEIIQRHYLTDDVLPVLKRVARGRLVQSLHLIGKSREPETSVPVTLKIQPMHARERFIGAAISVNEVFNKVITERSTPKEQPAIFNCDTEAALLRFGNFKSAYATALDMFATDLGGLITFFSTQSKIEDADQVNQLHSLKGEARALGFLELGARAEHLEEQINSGELQTTESIQDGLDMDQWPALIDKIRQQVHDLYKTP